MLLMKRGYPTSPRSNSGLVTRIFRRRDFMTSGGPDRRTVRYSKLSTNPSKEPPRTKGEDAMPKKTKKTTKTFTFGTCEYERTSPDRTTLSPRTKVVNIFVPFDEVLKLNLAIDESLRKLNKYKRSTTEGKRAALNLSIHLEAKRITVNEGKLRK